MRHTFTFLILLFSSINFAQDWTTRTETPENSFGYGLNETVDGFISIGTDSLLADYTSKILVTKFSMCGDIIWENLLEPYGSSTAAGVSITYLSDGNYAGMGIIGSDSIYYFKMNTEGDLLWEKIFHSSYYLPETRTIGQIEEDEAGNLYLMSKQYMFKCDASGEVLWTIDFQLDDNMICRQFVIDPDDKLLILGFNIITGENNLIKCDETGSIIYTKNTYFEHHCIAHLGSQLVLGGGIGLKSALRFFDLDGDSIATHMIPYNVDDAWLVEYEDLTSENVLKVAVLSNGNLAIRINYYGYAPFPWVKPYATEYDYMTEEVVHETFINDLSSTPLFTHFSGDIVGTFDDGYACIGASYLVDEDDIQMTLWKFNDDCTSGTETNHQTELNVYPNPAYNDIKIETNDEIIAIRIYNMEGRQLNFPLSIQNNVMDLRLLPTGMYILEIETQIGISPIKLVKN